MLKNYLTVALRNLRKYKGYALINVTGLAIGLACFILIVLFVRDEMGYDGHHTRADDLYRLVVDVRTSSSFNQTAQSPPAWGPDLTRDFPEVVNFVRLKPPNQKWMVGYDDRQFYEKGLAFADSTIFDVFSISMIEGDAATALDAPYSMVLSRSMAAKYFPGVALKDLLQETITLDSQYRFRITGVMEDMPRNGHFHFGFLPSISTLAREPIYGNRNFLNLQFPVLYTYLLLEAGTPPEALEAKLPAFIEKYVGAHMALAQSGFEIQAFLQPLRSIHLHSQRENEIEPNGDVATVYIFLAIALFILVIASINFMNLATARSASRAREVGMRKVVGAHRWQLVQQFLGESVLLALIGLVLAVGLVALALPEFEALTGKTIGRGALFDPVAVAAMIGLAVVVGALAGLYPAFFLSAFRPSEVLKGTLAPAGLGRTTLRKTLIVFQFGISIVLIISTGIVFRQMEFVRSKTLGFDKEHVVVVQLTDPTPRALYRSYRRAVEQDPRVVAVSASSSAPASLVNEAPMQPVAAAQDQNWFVKAFLSDFDFVETMDMRLVAGRTHSPDYPADTLGAAGPLPDDQTRVTSIVLNQTAAQDFGWDDPQDALGQDLQFTGGGNLVARVVGVVEDFHSQSVHERIAPAMIMFGHEQTYLYVFVRIRPGNPAEAISSLQQTWNEVMPNYAFEYSFLDSDFDRLYRREDVLRTLLGFFALLTVFIACLGLFGLASFTAVQRTKEIGVRKTLGATVPSIVLLLSKEVTVLIAVAFVPAALVAYVFMADWLGDFAYRIALVQEAWWVFVLAGVSALLIGWLTVGYQSIRAALADPVKALRYE